MTLLPPGLRVPGVTVFGCCNSTGAPVENGVDAWVLWGEIRGEITAEFVEVVVGCGCCCCCSTEDDAWPAEAGFAAGWEEISTNSTVLTNRTNKRATAMKEESQDSKRPVSSRRGSSMNLWLRSEDAMRREELSMTLAWLAGRGVFFVPPQMTSSRRTTYATRFSSSNRYWNSTKNICSSRVPGRGSSFRAPCRMKLRMKFERG